MCIIVYDLCLGWICHYVLTAYGAESCFHNVFVAESVMKKVHCCFTYDLSCFHVTSFCTDFISHCRHCGECVWVCVGRADDTRKQCEALTWCFLSNSDISVSSLVMMKWIQPLLRIPSRGRKWKVSDPSFLWVLCMHVVCVCGPIMSF